MSVGGFPGRFGAFIPVADSASLATMSVNGLTPGTLAWNADVGRFFKLTVPSSAALVTDEVVEVYRTAGARWIVQDAFTPEDAAKLATVPDGFSIPFYRESGTINLALVGSSVTIVPALPGYAFIPVVTRLRVLTRNDAATTAPTCKTGTNGAHDNYGTAALSSTANINGVAARMSISASLATTVGVPELELTSPLVTEVTIAAASAGTMAMTGTIIVCGTLVAV